MSIFPGNKKAFSLIRQQLPADITEDELAALQWLSTTDHRVKISGIAAFVSGTAFAAYEMITSSDWTPVSLMICAAIIGLMIHMVASIFYSVIPSTLMGGAGFRYCVKTCREFVRLSGTRVGASSLPQEIRLLYMHVSDIRSPTSGSETPARRIYKKAGPETALNFLRFCSAFKNGNRILNSDIAVSDEMKRVARDILRDAYGAQGPTVPVLLDMNGDNRLLN